MTLAQDFIGVTVAKNWIEVFHLSSSKHERIPATKRALSKFARAVRGCRVVCEASGGYERPLMDTLTSAGIDCAPVQRCRDAEMQRCRDAEMQRCRDGMKHQPKPSVATENQLLDTLSAGISSLRDGVVLLGANPIGVVIPIRKLFIE